MTQQKGSAHIILISALILAIVVALGIIYWQSVAHTSPANRTTQSSTKKPVGPSSPAYVDLRKNGKDDTGLVLSSKADVATASALNNDLKTYFSKEVGTMMDGMGSPMKITYTIDRIDGNYAAGSSMDAYYIWGPKNGNGSITTIAGTQNLGFKCSDLQAARVPSVLVDNKCYLYDGNGTGAQPYTQQ